MGASKSHGGLFCFCAVLICYACQPRSATKPLLPFPTNAPMSYRLLDRPWIGENKVVIRTGSYAAAPSEFAWEKEIRLVGMQVTREEGTDLGVLPPKSLILWSEIRFDDGSAGAMTYIYRPALPTASGITNCATLDCLVELLGEPEARVDPFDQFVWHVFTMKSTNTMDVLTVHRTSTAFPSAFELFRAIVKQGEASSSVSASDHR
jgi:hypothetical protein